MIIAAKTTIYNFKRVNRFDLKLEVKKNTLFIELLLICDDRNETIKAEYENFKSSWRINFYLDFLKILQKAVFNNTSLNIDREIEFFIQKQEFKERILKIFRDGPLNTKETAEKMEISRQMLYDCGNRGNERPKILGRFYANFNDLIIDFFKDDENFTSSVMLTLKGSEKLKKILLGD